MSKSNGHGRGIKQLDEQEIHAIHERTRGKKGERKRGGGMTMKPKAPGHIKKAKMKRGPTLPAYQHPKGGGDIGKSGGSRRIKRDKKKWGILKKRTEVGEGGQGDIIRDQEKFAKRRRRRKRSTKPGDYTEGGKVSAAIGGGERREERCRGKNLLVLPKEKSVWKGKRDGRTQEEKQTLDNKFGRGGGKNGKGST